MLPIPIYVYICTGVLLVSSTACAYNGGKYNINQQVRNLMEETMQGFSF